MKVSNHVYAKKMLFQARTPAGVMERTVYVYVVAGNEASCLIDTGVVSGVDDVFDFIASTGRNSKDISEILISHAHVDHIGALCELKRRLGCPAAASADSTRWIEDINAQFQKRPVPGFKDFVKESAVIDRNIKDGDIIELGNSTLRVYAAPGHEQGQLAFIHEQDRVLFTADSIPIPGEIPIYDDVAAQVDTLHRLSQIADVKVLLLSWGEPYEGQEAVAGAFKNALEYVMKVHKLTQDGIAKYGATDTEAVAKYVHGELGLPAGTFNLLFTNTIKAHICSKDLKITII